MSKIPSLSRTSFKKINEIQSFLFDCDGVIWNGNILIDGSKELINHLKNIGKKVFLITNNSTKSRSQYAVKCQKLGLNVSENEIICTAYVAASYLRQINFDGKLYAVGLDGIHKELEAAGIRHVMSGSVPTQGTESLTLENAGDVTLDPEVTDVLVGFDPNFNYRMMLFCTTYIAKGGRFFATNEDAFFPTKNKDGIVLPGTGAIVKSVEKSTGRKPIVMGKPCDPIMKVLAAEHHVDPPTALMVGDRLDTDIWFGNHNGITTAVVLTGVTSEKDLNESLSEELRPTFVMQSVRDLLNALTEVK